MARFNGTAKNDTLIGTAENDQLYGYAGGDYLNGGDGNDIDELVGGLGDDILVGSIGKDLFVFNDAQASIYKDEYNNYHVFSDEGYDTILKFSEAEGDEIVKPIFALNSFSPPLYWESIPIPPNNILSLSDILSLAANTLEYTLSSSYLTLEYNSLQDLSNNNKSYSSADTFGFEL